MQTETFAPFRITVCGLEELHGHCERGVSHVLSIMDPDLAPPPVFGAFGEHVRLDLRFDDVIEVGQGKQAPQREHVEAILGFGRDLLAEGRDGSGAHLLVHCHAGVSRSTAAMALILAQARPDRSPAAAMAEVARIRPQAWPNLRIIEMGDAMLGLQGGMVTAAYDRYRAVAKVNPGHVKFFREMGRGREVEHLDVG